MMRFRRFLILFFLMILFWLFPDQCIYCHESTAIKQEAGLHDATLNNKTNSAIDIVITQIQTPCFGASTGEAQAIANSTNGGPYSFIWSNGQTGSVVNGLTAGTYTVTVTDGANEMDSTSIMIQQYQAVIVNVAFVPPSCHGLPNATAAINLLNGGAGMGDTSFYNFHWSAPGSGNVTQLNGLSGDITYGLTVTDFEGCSGSYTFTVNQPPAIVINTNIQHELCFGDAMGSIQITGIQNASLPVSYLWSSGSAGTTIQNLTAGIYTVTATDSKGCQQVTDIEIFQPEALSLSFENTELLCASDLTAEIIATVNGGEPDYQFLWSDNSIGSSISQLGPGVYGLTVTDKNNCSVSGSQIIQPADSLILSATNTEPTCFGGQDGRIKLNIDGGLQPFRYSLNGQAFGGSSTFLGLRADVYTLEVQDANGCTAQLTDTLQQPAPVEVLVSADTSIVFGESVMLSAEAFNTVGNTQFYWSASLVDSFFCVDSMFCDQIMVIPAYSNTFQITAIDANGCSGKTSVQVSVQKPHGVFVPTAFSPNGDQINDLLVVHGLSGQVNSILNFSIYDRWGELVYQDMNFEVNQPNRGWDGSFRGQACDPGVFVWHLEVEYTDGFRENLKGTIMLIR
ncbi:MAG: gliding motility-associated C-terminal domain-containing protein [Saprospiraceae bacterium]